MDDLVLNEDELPEHKLKLKIDDDNQLTLDDDFVIDNADSDSDEDELLFFRNKKINFDFKHLQADKYTQPLSNDQNQKTNSNKYSFKHIQKIQNEEKVMNRLPEYTKNKNKQGVTKQARNISKEDYNPIFEGLKTVVFDNGSEVTRVGLSGAKEPIFKFPSYYSESSQMFGYEMANPYQKGTIDLVIQHGVIKNFEGLQKIWDYSYDNLLKLNPDQQPVILSTKLNKKGKHVKYDKKDIAEYMFYNLQVNYIYLKYNNRHQDSTLPMMLL